MKQLKDLRVGNQIFNGVVTEVREDGFKFHDGCVTWDSINIRSEALEALPITPDFLLKYDFVPDFSSCLETLYKREDFGIVEENADGYFYWGGNANSIQLFYVHELQNLFYKLTTKELTPTK